MRSLLSMLTLLAAVVLLLGPAPGLAAAEEPPADLVADLERQLTLRSGAPCPGEAAYSLTRPDATAGPTVVALGIYFQDVASLSDVDQTLDADVYVFARWRDPRLAEPARAARAMLIGPFWFGFRTSPTSPRG